MTPSARVSAAIEILDSIAEGLAAEQALTRWARGSRYAGSKDRAAVRDHVFDVVRQRRSVAHAGNGVSGRALMIGLLQLQGADLEALFNGEGHSPAALTPDEETHQPVSNELGVEWNLPDWLVSLFQDSLGDQAAQTALSLQSRAPICLRVNVLKTSVSQAQDTLATEGIQTTTTGTADTALIVTEGARKIRNSESYTTGLVELQDAASQAVVTTLPSVKKALDYCAGGGGKALALAMSPKTEVFAHDVDPRRMTDLPKRAERAGVTITSLTTGEITKQAPFDLVFCDAPCSGSGAWRRAAEAKWTLTPTRLSDLNTLQDRILDQAKVFVGDGGTLAYATCSVLRSENEDRVNAFLERHPDWECLSSQRFNVDGEADGFFAAHLTRKV